MQTRSLDPPLSSLPRGSWPEHLRRATILHPRGSAGYAVAPAGVLGAALHWAAAIHELHGKAAEEEEAGVEVFVIELNLSGGRNRLVSPGQRRDTVAPLTLQVGLPWAYIGRSYVH